MACMMFLFYENIQHWHIIMTLRNNYPVKNLHKNGYLHYATHIMFSFEKI